MTKIFEEVKPVEAVIGMVLLSAKRLGLEPDSKIVNEAIEVAKLAFLEGYDTDLCAELSRGVLIRATQPELVFAAA